jgi:hypothetical protein
MCLNAHWTGRVMNERREGGIECGGAAERARGDSPISANGQVTMFSGNKHNTMRVLHEREKDCASSLHALGDLS